MGLGVGTSPPPQYCRRKDDPPCPNKPHREHYPHAPQSLAATPRRRKQDKMTILLRVINSVKAIADHVIENGELPDDQTMAEATHLIESHNVIANVLGERKST